MDCEPRSWRRFRPLDKIRLENKPLLYAKRPSRDAIAEDLGITEQHFYAWIKESIYCGDFVRCDELVSWIRSERFYCGDHIQEIERPRITQRWEFFGVQFPNPTRPRILRHGQYQRIVLLYWIAERVVLERQWRIFHHQSVSTFFMRVK